MTWPTARWARLSLVAAIVIVGGPAAGGPTAAEPPGPAVGESHDHQGYAWPTSSRGVDCLAARIAAPRRYARVAAKAGSFAAWLRHLPLKPAGSPVLHFDGTRKRAEVDAAVVEIDTGRRDLQQCADAVIRLRAEYMFTAGRAEEIQFDFTSGDPAPFAAWARGERPVIRGSDVRWGPGAEPDATYPSFRRYLDLLFTYAGTASLSRELEPVGATGKVGIGDVFVEGGFPGHAVIVVDLAVDLASGRRVFLLAQSYMPAQDIHVLRNPAASDLDPWYADDLGGRLETAEWTFERAQLMRFKVE